MFLLKVCQGVMEGVVSAVGQVRVGKRQPAGQWSQKIGGKSNPLSYSRRHWALGGRGKRAGLHNVLGMGLTWILRERGEERSGTWEIRPLVVLGHESLAGTQISDPWS